MFKNQIIFSLNKHFILVILPRVVLVIFILLQITGMIFYPGGTLHNPDTIGYSFTENFFSDMGTYKARNSDPNYLSMIFFSFSLTLVGVTFFFYYLVLPQTLGNDRINYILTSVGTIFAFGGSICLIGTGLTPSDIVFSSHVFFANNIFHCFLITALLYTIVIFRSQLLEQKYAIGYGLFFISIFIYVGVLQFGPSVDVGQGALIFQVVAQKIIVLVFCSTIFHQTFGLRKLGKF
tara:strand:- start:759 stop:1463 length:705 start_codon:yes stop_codon:yes gene_type:complete